MARDPELLKLRDARIHEVYARLRAKRHNGKPEHTVAWIIEHISTKHVFVSNKTVEKVLYGKSPAKRKPHPKAKEAPKGKHMPHRSNQKKLPSAAR